MSGTTAAAVASVPGPADTSVQSIVLWVLAVTTIFNLASLIWGVFSGPSRKNAQAIEAMSKEVELLKARMSLMEQELRTIPAKEEMHELELAMTRLQGELKTMSETMRGQSEIMKRLEALVSRHEDHLLKK